MICAFLLALATTSQDVQVSTTAQLRSAIANARPGQRIVIAPGNYDGGLQFRNLHGTEEKPIVIAGKNPDDRPLFTGGNSGLHFSQISHVEIRDIIIKSPLHNGLNIDDGGSVETPSHHVTIRNVLITDMPKGNNDGIKLSGVDDFLVTGCTVERWGGSGIDMVGCHRGVIEDCTFRDGGASGVQGKGGTSDVAIRRCQFVNAGQRAVCLGGSTGNPYFRPPLSAMPARAKYEAKNLTVEGCTFVGSLSPFAFVGVDGAVVRFNTVYMPDRWAIRILQETQSAEFLKCRNGVFSDNIVVFSSANWASGGVNIGPGTSPKTFRFERNFWYCADRPRSSAPSLPVHETNGTYGTDPQFVNPARHDFRLKPSSPAKSAGATAFPRN